MSSDSIVAKAEEDVHVEAEIAQAQQIPGGAEPITRAELDKILKGTGSEMGGLQSSAAPMRIYNRYDGFPSDITTDQAGQRLRVRFDAQHPWAGQLVWTTKPPDTPPEMGKFLCPLHRESDQREYLDSLNFGRVTCRKATLRTTYDVDGHFKGKHREIFKAVEADKARQLEIQRMDLMREQTAAMQAMAAAQGVQPAKESCPVDGCDYEGTPNQVRGHKMGAHKEPAPA